jgi:hypothetical protein
MHFYRELEVGPFAETFQPGSPDFSWYKIPKWGEIYQIAINISKGRKIDHNDHKIYQDFPLQCPLPKLGF